MPLSIRRPRRIAALAVMVALVVSTASCGGSDGDSGAQDDSNDPSSLSAGGSGTDDGGDEVGEQLADALGAGGGGTLVIDGEEIVIDSVICAGDSENFEVGTVSDNGYRVLISSSSTGTPSSQILDPDFIQWFPSDQNAPVQIDGGTYTSGPTTYFNNSSDDEIEVSYTVECP